MSSSSSEKKFEPYVVLGSFTYDELTGNAATSLETIKSWDWTYTENASTDTGWYRTYNKTNRLLKDNAVELEPVAMVPFAPYGMGEPDYVFVEGLVFKYNAETKKFEDTGYTPTFKTNQTDSKNVWIGSAVAGNVTGSADGAETVYYTYYEKKSDGTAYYTSVAGLWGEETNGDKSFQSAVKSNTSAASPVHITLALSEEEATADTTKAEISFADGELDENGAMTLVEGGCKPKVVVTCNGKQLRPGKDYYVVYTDNTEEGTGTAVITGMGDYKGTGSLYFEIVVPDDGGEDNPGDISYEVETIAPVTVADRTWDSYKSYYYYNFLNEAERDFWDQLDAVCKEMLTTTKDARKLVDADGNVVSYVTEDAVTTQLTKEEANKVVTKFLISNPQYYFLTNLGSLTPSGSKIRYCFDIYAQFATGESRQEANALIEEKLAEYYTEIDVCSTDEEKVRTIHDMMLEKITPSSGHTIYQVLTTQNAQCEGYAELFQMLANGAGIDTINVTKADIGHEWNMVKLNGSWYSIDITWDDPVDGDGSLYYRYYLLSAEEDSRLSNLDSWCDPLPTASLSSGSTMYQAGTISAAKGYTTAPKIAVDTASGTTTVTLTAKSTETIYYSLDGSTPGVGRGRSFVYTEPITIEEPCIIKAVAVRDGYIDNKVSIQEVKGIRFDGNGSEEGTVSSILLGADAQVTIPENSYVKSGCRFKNWNTAADGTGTAYEAGDVLNAADIENTFTLYAQWEDVEYTITYELAGGTNSDSNPSGYKASDAEIILADPGQKGYTFEGWYTSADYSGSKVESIPSGSEGDITLYAKWTPWKYHILFDANGGKGTMSEIWDCKFGETYTLPANQYTKSGYKFVGWCNYSDGSKTIYEDQIEYTGQLFSDLLSNDNIAIMLYAIWEEEGSDPVNPDPTNPDPVDPDPTNPDPVNPDPTNPDPVDPDPTNPDPVNPDPTNPDSVNPDPVNPDPVNPSTDNSQKIVGSVAISNTVYTYTGKKIQPQITVKGTDGTVVDKKYYSVVYANNINVGTATATITFKDVYSGNQKVTKTFTINPKGTKIATLKAGKKKLTVKIKAQKKQTSGYQIRYSLKKNMSKAKLVTMGTKTSKTISKLKGKKTYYVQVRTFKKVSGKTYYSAWSKAVSKKVKE